MEHLHFEAKGVCVNKPDKKISQEQRREEEEHT